MVIQLTHLTLLWKHSPSSVSSLLHWSIYNPVRIHWKRPWCWERLRAGREGGDRDEMVGWHHQLKGQESEQALVDSEGQGSLVCCSSWGCTDWTHLCDWTTRRTINAQNNYQGVKHCESSTDQDYHLIILKKLYRGEFQ